MLIERLSRAAGSFPVVLSQDGEVVCCAGLADETLARRFARLADRLWRVGGPAREVIRFEEELIGEGDEQHGYMIYSAHVTGALTLTVGWQLSLSLTQLRAEAADIIEELRGVVESGK